LFILFLLTDLSALIAVHLKYGTRAFISNYLTGNKTQTTMAADVIPQKGHTLSRFLEGIAIIPV
jgi:hypothetical protein